MANLTIDGSLTCSVLQKFQAACPSQSFWAHEVSLLSSVCTPPFVPVYWFRITWYHVISCICKSEQNFTCKRLKKKKKRMTRNPQSCQTFITISLSSFLISCSGHKGQTLSTSYLANISCCRQECLTSCR